MSSRIRTKSLYDDREDTVYHNPEDPTSIWPSSGWKLGTRHAQCFMLCLGAISSFFIRGYLSVAIVSMTQKSKFNDAPVMPWDSRMKGVIMSSFFWSYMFVLIPAGQLCEKYSAKVSFASAMFFCGVVMLLTPVATVYGGFYWMIASRLLQGATQAFQLPSASVLLSKWAPPREKGLLFGCIVSGVDIGIVLIMPIAGTLVESRWGWPSVFYVCGAITISWSIVYAYFGANSPQDHKTISECEKAYILKSISSGLQKNDNLKTPWKAIATSAPFLAVVIAHSAETWGFYTLLFLIPSYINGVLGLNMQHSGFLTALPYLSHFIATNVFGCISQWLNNKEILSRTTLLKMWNSLSFFGTAFLLCLLAFTEKNQSLVVGLLIVTMALHSGQRFGFFPSNLYLSPNFAGTLMGISTTMSTFTTLGAPLYAGFIVTDSKSVYLWRIVFLTVSIAYVVGNLVFITFGSAEVQPWNFPPNRGKLKSKTSILKEKFTKNSEPSEV